MDSSTPATALPLTLLKRPDVRDALAAHDFGTVFRLARSEAGISYSKVAAACDIKPERVGNLARGRGRIASFDKICAIADALRIPGHMVGLAPRDWEDADNAFPPSGRGGLDPAEEGDAVRRRDLFKVTAGLAVSLPALAQPVVRGRIGEEMPHLLRERAARLRRLDEVLGGGDTYRVYVGEFQATKRMLRECTCTERVRRELESIAAEQAQQAGWAAFDNGKHADAQSLYEESRGLAIDADDQALSGNALAFLAYQRVGQDRQEAAAIANESCRTAGADVPTRVRALLEERRAWACAVAGHQAETERALGAAQEALQSPAEGPQPDWASWVDENELQIMTGRCWAALDRPLRAVPVLEAALSQYPDAHARDKSLYMSWLAESYASAGEYEQAAAVVRRCLELATGVASVRPRERLRPVLGELRAHQTLPAVADVLDLATA